MTDPRHRPETLASTSSLAADLRELGDVEAARQLEQGLDLRRALGPDRPDPVTSTSNLAIDRNEMGEAAELGQSRSLLTLQ